MPRRYPQKKELIGRRIREHMKVLKYLMDSDNLEKSATGGLKSPPKLVIFFAGYIAMRRIWELRTDKGKIKIGDPEIDVNRSDKSSIIYRIDKEVAHPLGFETSTLFRMKTFKRWGNKFLKL